MSHKWKIVFSSGYPISRRSEIIFPSIALANVRYIQRDVSFELVLFANRESLRLARLARKQSYFLRFGRNRSDNKWRRIKRDYGSDGHSCSGPGMRYNLEA